jgi:UDP-N-acetylmuramoyl-L-alanyl-D-glutamate--2,6-diaminopimelate ligase
MIIPEPKILTQLCQGSWLVSQERAQVTVERDREAAIRSTVARARRGDIVSIAGKGHEDYQVFGTESVISVIERSQTI